MTPTDLVSPPSLPQAAPSQPSGERRPAPLPVAKKSSATLRLGWLALALAIVSAVGVLWLRAPKAPALRYETSPLEVGTVAARVTATGTLSALVTVNVGSQVSGRIESLRADFGTRVSQGQMIATIEPALFRAAAAQARANHGVALATLERALAEQVNAERQFGRARALSADGVMSVADLDTSEAALGVARANAGSARANVAQAQGALDQAQLNLRYTTIVSPIDGVVISRNVDVGQTVAATLQAPVLFTIARDLRRMQVNTSVAEADIGKIRAGMPAIFSVDAYPGRTFQGTIRQVRDNAQTVQNVVTYDAVIDVDNPDYLLKPGMTANVKVEYQRRDGVLRVSNAALRFRPDPTTQALMAKEAGLNLPLPTTAPQERLLWLVSSGRPRLASIQVGISDGTWTEITASEAQSGDSAIVEALPRKE
jgi:HlyD family secretion protein